MSNLFDFLKPRMDSEYPEVDKATSVSAYMEALDSCYATYRRKYAAAVNEGLGQSSKEGSITCVKQADICMDQFDFCILHSPYAKLVVKGYARLVCGWKRSAAFPMLCLITRRTIDIQRLPLPPH